MFIVSSLAVLIKRDEFSSQHTADEVSSTGRVLHHVGRSMVVGKEATWVLSSGVEGVTGDGERERAVVRDGEEGDMGEIDKENQLWTLGSAYLPARFKRRKTARFR